MRRKATILTVALSIALISLGKYSPGASASDAQPTSSRSFTFTYITHVPAMPAGIHQLRIWMPLPYEERSQIVSDVKIETPVRFKIEHEKEYGNRYAYFAVDSDEVKGSFDIRLTFHAQRLVPINGEIAQISGEQTQGATEPVGKARRLYNYVVSTMHYDHEGTGWGRGDAVWACDNKHGNCTDFHSFFIAMARAAGIPARFEIGFSLPTGVSQGAIGGYHCWAEFYVQGIGWIPVDASEASKNKDMSDYFFGATDQNRVMFSLGRDIRLKPGQKGEPLNYFVYPYAELDGKPFDGLKNEFSFRDDPKPKGTPTKVATSD
jgi:transglutaminase-like putative cysteine protease